MADQPKQKTGPALGSGGLIASETWEDWEPGPYNAFGSAKKRAYEYYLMARKDSTVRAALWITRFMILSKLGAYRNDDEAIEERVNELLEQIEGGMSGIFRRMLSALWAGYAVLEKEWDTSGSDWHIARCELLHPLTFFAKTSDKCGIALDPKSKRVEEVQQYQHDDQTYIDEPIRLPIDRVIYWPLLQEAREEVCGNSMLEGARRAWFSKIKEENYWNTFAEKCACPTPIFWVPPTSIADANGETKQLSEILIKAYEKLTPGQAMAIPIDADLPYKTDLLTPTGDGEAFERICRYWDSQLFKAILTPRLLLEEPEHASRAQASTNLDLFLLTLDGIRTEAGEVIVKQLVKPLVYYNVGDVDDYGFWEFEPFQQDDLELLARVFEMVERGKASAVQAGQPLYAADDDKLRRTFSDVYASPEEIDEEEPAPAPVPPIQEELKFGEAAEDEQEAAEAVPGQ